MHPCKGDPRLSALFLQPLAWGRLENYLRRTVVASSLLCNMKGAEIALMKGYLFSDETVFCSSVRETWLSNAEEEPGWYCLGWLYLRVPNLLRKKQRYNLPLLPTSSPLKKHQNTLIPSIVVVKRDQSPVSPFFQKGLKHNFTFELREDIILKRNLVIFSPNTQNHQSIIDLLASHCGSLPLN